MLLIAVDEINPELEKIIAYVSSFRSGLLQEALEVNIYQQGEIEVFVPQRHGQVSPEVGGVKAPLTLDEVIANAPDDHCRRLLELIVEEWQKMGHVVQARSAGASFLADINGNSQPIFWAFPDYLQPVMDVLASRKVPSAALATYRSALATLPGFNKTRMLSDARPPTGLSKLSEAEIRAFVAESDKLVNAWRVVVSQ